MDRFLFCFITASLSTLIWPFLLPAWVTVLIGIIGILALKTAKSLSGLCLGITWMLSLGHWITITQPTESLFLQPVVIEGRVKSVVSEEAGIAFTVEVTDWRDEAILSDDGPITSAFKIRLSWLEPQFAVKQGQTVSLLVKLKPRWGLRNEAGFNYQQWLLSENIVATGYVKTNNTNRVLRHSTSIRQRIADRLLENPQAENRWLLALAIGFRGQLMDQDWQLLQSTGTAHLVAISGMHLGMVALWIYTFFAAVLSVINLISRRVLLNNVRLLALGGTVFFSLGYVMLAGFATPTLRAWLMLLLAWLLLLAGVNWRSRRFILTCLGVFILLFPLSIFSISFWLSFSAILVLWFLAWRLPVLGQSVHQKLYYFFCLQCSITLLMLTLILVLFGGVSFVSLVVNLVAIPFVTFILLPLSLATTLCVFWNNDAGHALLEWTLALFALSEYFLEQVSGYDLSWVTFTGLSWLAIGFATLGMVLIFLPKLFVPKPLYGLLFLPLLTSTGISEKLNWQLDLLDVGQGLSVLIRRHDQAMIYDVGAEYPEGLSMVNTVILPVLQAAGIRHLEAVILSHFDIDHAGGLGTLWANQRFKNILHPQSGCKKGHHWQWQGIRFIALWPDPAYPELLLNDNNQSCVIMLDDGNHRVLLTGDIEQEVELLLVQWYRAGEIDLRADVLVAAHHGSKTSTSSPFILAVEPHYVLVSSGYRNRWGMPAAIVKKRTDKIGAKLLNTAEQGQISVQIDKKGRLSVSSWRKDIQPRWYLSATY